LNKEDLQNKKEDVKENVEDKKVEKKKQAPKIKRDEAVVNGISLPISTKDSVAICKFIRRKTIQRALVDLELVSKLKKAIPMTGEIPHRKGKGMMSGRYMTKPVLFFIKMLKSLEANANMNGMDEPVIVEAVPNRASRPYGSGGRKRKRTHIHIKVVEKNKLKMEKKKSN
jgi:ribosomal protein L22